MLIVATYVALARLGQILAIPPGNVTPVYPAAGLALACVLIRGNRVWPAIALGQLLGNTWAFLDASSWSTLLTTTAVGATMSAGTVLQAWLGAYLIGRFCGTRNPFSRVTHVFAFVAAAMLSCLIASSVGAASLCASGIVPWPHLGHTWLTWYLGDAVGDVLVAPVMLTWPTLQPPWQNRARAAEGLLMLSANTALALLVFTGLFSLNPIASPLAFMSVPLLLWAAARFGQFGVSAVILVVCAVAIYGTESGYGPFQTGHSNSSLLLLQVFVAVSMITGLSFGASLKERNQSEQALRRAESRLEQVVVAGNVGLWDWEMKTNNVIYSDQFKRQLGYPPGQQWVNYDEWETRLHPADREAAVQRICDYFEGRTRNYISTFRLRHKDGSYRWILSQGSAERDAQDKPIRLFGVHVDITERKLHVEALQRANSELKQFAYAASHDLQEPLRSIAGFGQLLQQKHREQLDEESRRWLEAIISGGKRLQTLIQDLLRYAVPDRETHPRQETETQSVVRDAVANLEDAIQSSKASVVFNGDLPAVRADRSQLVQLFQNLIGNAIKFRGDEPPTVHIEARRAHDQWLFSIRDNGVGIPAQQHKKIFDVFGRIHHRSGLSGNGMGLAICRRVVQRHQGRIWVESTPGQGSTFFFTLPAAT